jgi:glycosyltransferase involved in cell wall biosynthesis
MATVNTKVNYLEERNICFRIGFTEAHGMAKELCISPPTGVEYSFLIPLKASSSFLRSPIKGFFGRYETRNHDLIEAVLSPIFTNNRWIYSLANFHEAMAFNFLGIPLPRTTRFALIKHLLFRDNFKKLIFWSQAGKNTLQEYLSDNDWHLFKKVAVVYPAIREVPDNLVKYNNNDVHILFTGDFFRKGGVNVIDAFEMAQKIFPNIKLILCCNEKIDFNTQNDSLKREYLRKIDGNKGIIIRGRIPRDELLYEVLPRTDIYLLPTYVEAFGFAILEAMAYGIPVISTNHFAIPEMIEHNVSGYLIDTSKFDCDKLFKGYVVNQLPDDFRNHVTDNLYVYLIRLIESADERTRIGLAGLQTARTKFSFKERNTKMLEIYTNALNLTFHGH